MSAPDDKSSSFPEKALEAGERIFNLIWHTDNPQDFWHWLILIFFVLVVAGVLVIIAFKALGSALEHLVKFVEAYKSSGLPMWLNPANKSRVRRRKQFCGVLDADLSYLAKAENWNDQYFTDLEAEVETEGGYYATAWDKICRRKSFGLRKERSLIRAITTSAERAMQLIGEPGSGKSVALRHLAKQLAEQGRKSNDKNAIVPLYINLREMEHSDKNSVNADGVREFVLDNIRRGDADTSAFVRENWDDYCNRGIWLFLFDSFDEIPAVLHSEAGSNVVRLYSQAIRQFLEGMGECKGILASREFKGPEALPWKKLRILPLSGEKQDELIQNSFLDAQYMKLVRQHLAGSHSSIGSTPLFLTLLCRYVRDEHHAPNNDHDILLQHIERLARREPEYLSKKYRLTPDELIVGAERLARLFAEDDTLSLAPSLDQIIAKLPAAQIPEGTVERLISALVDCKIGRADVPNAAQGDRKFAFAHRRYQEALFVRFLTRHPEALSANQLLTEPRWREYTVTLLQTRNPHEISNLLDHACEILEFCAAQQQSTKVYARSPLPADLGYFNWTSDVGVPILNLLQEGLARRLQDVPVRLSIAVSSYLDPRWETGDTWDRCEVLRLGGLLPHDTLVKYLVETFDHGTKAERFHAFRQAAFTSKLPDLAKTAVLKMLSDQVILASNRADQLTVEALAARLPSSLGANFVVSRGNKLRRSIGWMQKIGSSLQFFIPLAVIRSLMGKLISSINSTSNVLSFRPKNVPMVFDILLPLVFLVPMWSVCAVQFAKGSSNTLIAIFALISAAILIYCVIFCPFLVRHHGGKVRLSDIGSWIYNRVINREFVAELFALFLTAGFALGVSVALGYFVDWLAREYLNLRLFDVEVPTIGSRLGVGFATIVTLTYAFMIPTMLLASRNIRRQAQESDAQLENIKKSAKSDVEILYAANNSNQLIFWLESHETLLSDFHSIRIFSSFVLATLLREIVIGDEAYRARASCFSRKVKSSRKEKEKEKEKDLSDLKRMRQILEDRFIKQSK